MPVFYVSFIVTLILTPLMRHLAHRHGVVDDPDGKRKVHSQPIAYLGGISIFLGWVAGVSMSIMLKPHNADPGLGTISVPPGVLLGAAIVVLFGLLDDVYSLSPKVKLAGQFLAALLLLLPGFIIPGPVSFLGDPTSSDPAVFQRGAAWMLSGPAQYLGLMNIETMTPGSLVILKWTTLIGSALIGIAIIVSTCNATNLLDGLDGLCSGVTGIMAVGYLLLSLYMATTGLLSPESSAGDAVRITLSLALLGAVMGFLPFNFNPASIFMGDTGSMFLGFICGTMMLLFSASGLKGFMGAVVIFGLPMLDTFLAIVRRKLNGKPIFSPDSNHLHHFLIRRGLSVKKAVLLSYGLAAVFVSFALVIVIVPTRLALGLYLVLFAWLVVAAFKMGIIFQKSPGAVNGTINTMVLSADKPLVATPAATPVGLAPSTSAGSGASVAAP